MASRLEEAFSSLSIDVESSGYPHVLHYFLHLYFEHFHALWPLFPRRGFDFDSVPPMLYLTMSVVGSLYAGEGGSHYGWLLHENLRMALMTAPFVYHESGSCPEWLVQSMLITQMTILYSGQTRAFSYAQHLGSILGTECRKMNLLSDDHLRSGRSRVDRGIAFGPESSLSRWVHAETRRRLAYGIYRAEIMLSVLLNTRPLVSFEEINLTLPCSDDLLLGEGVAVVDELEVSLRRDDVDSSGLLFSDLMRIATDRSEVMPDLDVRARELVLFGLQEAIWRFGHDPDMFDRLTGSGPFVSPFKTDNQHGSELFASRHMSVALTREEMLAAEGRVVEPLVRKYDHLDCSLRTMNDLRLDFDRTISALQRWKQSFVGGQNASHLQRDRDAIVSSRLLYHLSFLRLKADIESLHQVAYKVDPDHHAYQDILNRVYLWSHTKSAENALEHACAVWSLISSELARDKNHRAKFTLLSLIALHHAAIIVWAYAGTHQVPGSKMLERMDAFCGVFSGDFRIYRANTYTLLTHFATMFRAMTPAWNAMSSFSITVARMAELSFPLTHDPRLGKFPD